MIKIETFLYFVEPSDVTENSVIEAKAKGYFIMHRETLKRRRYDFKEN